MYYKHCHNNKISVPGEDWSPSLYFHHLECNDNTAFDDFLLGTTTDLPFHLVKSTFCSPCVQYLPVFIARTHIL